MIDKLSSKNSSGANDIPSKLLKQIKSIIIKPLTIIINQSLKKVFFPDLLKVAKVILVFKKVTEFNLLIVDRHSLNILKSTF